MYDGDWVGKRTAYFEYGEIENQHFKFGNKTITEEVKNREEAWFGTGRPFNSESDDIYKKPKPVPLLKRKS